jgi:trans-aconitate methyltransferase
VSGLVLNFLPQPQPAVQSMMDRVRPGGTIAAYVWDYADGMQFLRFFWEEAAAEEPSAADLDEARRFPLCHTDRLAELLRQAGMASVTTTSLQIARSSRTSTTSGHHFVPVPVQPRPTSPRSKRTPKRGWPSA